MSYEANTAVAHDKEEYDACYRFCCAPCWLQEVEGWSGMTLCCWLACCLMWPLNGFCALCYDAKPRLPAVVAIQQAYPIQQQPSQNQKWEPEYAGASAPFPAAGEKV
eukprot:TRINITY_DN43852_c0_g1_i1.p1 TRINITY_DN43852_c0_g1~~TRINITY_DN43852_c0_g1_i1.p1  ORF type:complete len:107 (+),score=16.49 TRINITY_DN43852_c0_g1_i1:58-378(+)